mmetsp:Transcript_27409/g.66562  ORF Transcript_27409/g.66562 Transcript_27409/m.66562 type:complete len:1032 (-) Transcript_27409:204-3299(-)
MSRRSRQDKTTWKVPSVYGFVGDYGPLKIKGFEPLDNVVVWLHRSNNSSSRKDKNGTKIVKKFHPMYSLTGPLQQLLLSADDFENQNQDPAAKEGKRKRAVLVIDVQSMLQDDDDDGDDGDDAWQTLQRKEHASRHLTKGLGRSLWRLCQRLILQNVTFVAQTDLCGTLLKLVLELHAMDSQLVHQCILVQPTFNNNIAAEEQPVVEEPLFVTREWMTRVVKQQSVSVQVVEAPNKDKDNSPHHQSTTTLWWNTLAQALGLTKDNQHNKKVDEASYDADYCSDMGKSLFCSDIKVEMNKYHKQYDRLCQDITKTDLVQVDETIIRSTPKRNETATEVAASPQTPLDWNHCQKHVGALVLRGNRCVLVRSLTGAWQGLRLPSVALQPGETATKATLRAVQKYTEVDAASEVQSLANVLPVAIYDSVVNDDDDGNHTPRMVELHALYAVEPPPDGPLEDADMEDDETLYDWYTYANAVSKLNAANVAALQTMSLNLLQAAQVGLIPSKWGGVFGQEMIQSFGNNGHDHTLPLSNHQTQSPVPPINANAPSPTTGAFVVPPPKPEEWKPSRQADVLQDVRKANEALNQRLAFNKRSSTNGKLPVTVLSGFLGSGKTTLLTHVLSNYEGLKVAILVNDMGDINIDAALVKSTVSVRQREEHMVEMSNGCICCTLREDLLVEVANIAADSSFDYLLIESSGISEPLPVAETFTFEDSTGLRLENVAEIDAMVTVVDGSRFLSELDSLESLQSRHWQSDPEDHRTISHLLCDQVEFANVILLNKMDLIKEDEKIKIKTLIRKMNPTARVVESTYSAVPLENILGTGLFSMKEAEQHEGWLQEERTGEHTPETLEYNIASFTYRAKRPFWPHKLNDALEAMMGQAAPPFDTCTILRAKGIVWLASCPQLQGVFSFTSGHYSLLPGNPWWAEIDKSHWPEGLEDAIAPLWNERHGDRQQEIVIIGQDLDQDSISKVLNDCLVSPEDDVLGQDHWAKYCEEVGDPFQQQWDEAIQLSQQEEQSHGHDHSHDHDHGHHHHH